MTNTIPDENQNILGNDAHLNNDTAGQEEMNKAFVQLEKLNNSNKPDVKFEGEEKDNEIAPERPYEEMPLEPESLPEPLPEEVVEEEAPVETVADEEAKEEAKPEKKKTLPPWDPKKEKFKLQAELEAKDQELAYLRSVLDQSKQASTENYEALLSNQVAAAEQAVQQAIDANDRPAFIKANTELSRIVAKENDFNKWKAEDEYQRSRAAEPEPSKVNAEPSRVQQSIVDDWNDYIEEAHPELIKNSRYYDESLYNEVANMVDKYNKDLQKKGYGDAIYSADYFARVNEGIANIREQFTETKKAKVILPAVPVSGVRNAYSNSIQGVTTAKPKSTKGTLHNEAMSIIDNFNAPWMDSKSLKKSWEANL